MRHLGGILSLYGMVHIVICVQALLVTVPVRTDDGSLKPVSCSVLACFIMKSLSVAMSNALKGGYCDEHKCGRFVSGVISTN